MSKKGMCMLLLLAVILTTIPVSASPTHIAVKLNGSSVSLKNAPLLINNRILVPSELIKKMGAVVEWKAFTKSILIIFRDSGNKSKTVYLKIGRTVALVDGVEIEMNAVPIIRKGVSFLPLKFIADRLNAGVKWTGKSKTVDITFKFPNENGSLELPVPWEIQGVSTDSAITINKQEENKNEEI